MAVIEIKANPTRKDLVVFALLWILFFGVLALVALRSAHSPYPAAIFTGGCFLVALAFNREQAWRDRVWGVAIPLALLALGLFRGIVDPRAVAGVLAAVGAAGGVATLASRASGVALYHRWMLAVLPIGWTISHVVLALMYFLVFTPIGLAMRLCGRDPMARRFEPGASTYWIPRRRVEDPGRYLRQS